MAHCSEPQSEEEKEEEIEPPTKKRSPAEPTPGASKNVSAGRARLRATEARLVHAAAAAERFQENQEANIALRTRKLDMLAAQFEITNRNAAEQLAVQRQLVGAIELVGRAMTRMATVAEIHYGLIEQE
jgi:hypothetical protein